MPGPQIVVLPVMQFRLDFVEVPGDIGEHLVVGVGRKRGHPIALVGVVRDRHADLDAGARCGWREPTKTRWILEGACVHGCMSIHPSPNLIDRFRRRVIVELDQGELELLADAERRCDTKRAGVVAALGAFRATRGDPEASDPGPNPRIADLEVRMADLEQDLVDARTELGTALSGLEAARAEADELRGQLAHLDRVRLRIEDAWADCESTLNAEIEDMRERVPAAAFCPRCAAWAPEAEWSWAPDPDGTYAFHTPCVDHGPGILAGSRLLRRGR